MERDMILDGNDSIPGHVPVQIAKDSAEKLEETGPAEYDSEEKDEHLSQTARTPATPSPKGEGTEPSVHTTISDVGRLWRKSAAASDRPG